MAEASSLTINVAGNITGAVNSLNTLQRHTQSTASKVNKDLMSIEKTSIGLGKNMVRSLTSVPAVISTLIGGLGLEKFKDLSDTYSNIDSRLKLVTKSTNEYVTSQRELFKIAQDTRTSFESTVDLYSKLSTSTESLGISQEKLLQVTETINKAGIIGGGSSESINAALVQLGQGLASGALRGEELNSVLEQTPRLAKAIADGMGVQVGALKSLAEQGNITSQVIIDALTGQAQTINDEYSKIIPTISGSLEKISNAFIVMVGDINNATGASTSLANAIDEIAVSITNNRDAIAEFSQYFSAYMGKAIDFSELFYKTQYKGAEYLVGALNVAVYGVLNIIMTATLKATEALNRLGISSNETLKSTKALADEVENQFLNATKMVTGSVNEWGKAYSDFNVSIESRIAGMKKEQVEINKTIDTSKKSKMQIEAEAKANKEAEKRIQELSKAYQEMAQIGLSEYDSAMFKINVKSQEWAEMGVNINAILDARNKLIDELNSKTTNKAFESSMERLKDEIASLTSSDYDVGLSVALKDIIDPKQIEEVTDLFNQLYSLEKIKEFNEENKKIAEDFDKDWEETFLSQDEKRAKWVEKWKQAGIDIEKVNQLATKKFKSEWEKTIDNMNDLSLGFKNTTENALKGLEDAFVEFARTGKMNMRDMADAIIADLMRVAVQKAIIAPIMSGLGSAFPTVFGTAYNGGIATSSGFQRFSSGGVVGGYSNVDSPSRDTIPALISEGEAVIPASVVSRNKELIKALISSRTQKFSNGFVKGGTGGVTTTQQPMKVEIINESGDKMEVKSTQQRNDIEGQVLSIVINAIHTNKMGMRTAIGGR